MADVPAAAEDVTGEVRSSLAPSKPQRTASMRDQATSQPILKKHGSSTPALNQDYEPATAPPTSDSLVMLLLTAFLTIFTGILSRRVHEFEDLRGETLTFFFFLLTVRSILRLKRGRVSFFFSVSLFWIVFLLVDRYWDKSSRILFMLGWSVEEGGNFFL